MRHISIFILLAIIILPIQAWAGLSDQSTQQMVLIASPQFLARIQYLADQEARVVLTETGIGITHACRARYAASIVFNPAWYVPTVAVMIVGGINLIGTVTGTGLTADSTASDAAILSQIATFWAALSGCDTGS